MAVRVGPIPHKFNIMSNHGIARWLNIYIVHLRKQCITALQCRINRFLGRCGVPSRTDKEFIYHCPIFFSRVKMD